MSQIKAIVNGKLVTPYHVIDDGVVLIIDDLIAECGTKGSIVIPEGAQIIDANHKYIGPGFIDIHCHGGGGHWSWEEPIPFAVSHLKFGTTGILPTLVYNLSREETLEGVKKILQAEGQPYSQVILGIHMEGPYINNKYGAITAPIRPVDPVEYQTLLACAGEQIKIWTLAPELKGQIQFAEAALAYDIVLSVGHSEADAETIFSFVPKGLRLGCHCTNASGVTPSPTRYGGTREVGVDEAVLVHDDIYAEIIPDAGGVHVRPLMCKLIHKTKGTNRVIIITDAINEAGVAPDPNQKAEGLYEDVRFIEGVGLSGSKLTMNKAVRNMMRHTGVGFVDVFIMASLNPAKLLKLNELVGSVEKGKLANLVIVSETMEVDTVIFQGNVVE
ncbi:N-acetylglucosamine-6-phosphate deacetylase [Paenibacillus agricola]|uniref:N-acetylglucosamine-6-phosphate deacetylase n=1 Tax=Paenibacillus agricola TaxID=2716264 RepID=A0ABX0J8M5_9BACL|nr:N-acetylglucosamine-6-phosphate deacetylase [Paenibacillus agricola]NHN32782.1 N-acetylglucosamine-6-phosphate deacetylase [Paenibacillus agricola]